MNEAQEAIFKEMEDTMDCNYNAFRADCDRLIAAGAIQVDIGAAVEALQSSPELCDVFAGLLKTEPVVWQYRCMYDEGHARSKDWCEWHDAGKVYYDRCVAEIEAGNKRLQVRSLCVASE